MDNLTYGQQKAGLSLQNTKTNTNDDVIETRIFFAKIFDKLDATRKIDDRERERLTEIAIDETNASLRIAIRALTFGKH